MSNNFHLNIGSDGRGVVSYIDSEGNIARATDEHSAFPAIVDEITSAAREGRDIDTTLVNELLEEDYVKRLVRISDRVAFDGDVLRLDGRAVHNTLARTIYRYHQEGRPVDNLVAFLTRLEANPSKRSRDQLWTWAQAKELTINEDGYLIAFKGVYDNGEDESGARIFRSSSSGWAVVNGTVVGSEDNHIQVPQQVGDVVEIPRTEVDDDPASGCSFGLHAGTFSYARSFVSGGTVLEVAIDPADVVSIPSDCGYAKLRCCRYLVVDIHDPAKAEDLSHHEPEATEEGWVEASVDDVEALKAIPESFLARLKNRLKGGK